MNSPALQLVLPSRPGYAAATLLEAQKDVLEMIVRGAPLTEVLAALCHIVERLSERPARAGILLADDEVTCLRTGAAPSLPEAYNRAVDGLAIHPDVGTCSAAAARREVVVTRDIESDAAWEQLRHLPLALGLRAAWSMPIFASNGTVLGTFGTYFTESREPTLPERQLVEVLARTASLAIERARTDAAERAFAVNRARLDYAVRLSGVGFWHCVLPLDQLNWDERVKEHFFLPADATGITIDDFYARIHPDDREPTRQAIEKALAERSSYDTVYRTVDPLGGAVKWIRALGGATYAPDGTPTHFDGVTLDVTLQKLDQEALARSLERERAQARLLGEQDRHKDEFLATLAHELRNPLAPIRNGLEILRRDSSPEHGARTREMMTRQLLHLVRMVDDLLDISRVRLGKVTLKRELVDFRVALSSAIETTRPLLEAARHEFSVRLPRDPLPVQIDATRIAQVIANVLNNAAKYTPPGGSIQLTAEIADGTLIVRVRDSGVGIPADMLPRVFEMFTQVGESIEHSQGGLGIGLTLVRRLMEMHGGSVTADSDGAGLGSTFTLRLPLALASDAPRPAPAEQRAGVRARRILVVDDNVDAADSLAMLLELEGHTTQRAHNGEEALTAVAVFCPDIVFLDIGLPKIGGHELARRLRADPNVPSTITLVALTGWGTEDDRRLAREAGFDLHLVKPVDPAELAETLGRSSEMGTFLVS